MNRQWSLGLIALAMLLSASKAPAQDAAREAFARKVEEVAGKRDITGQMCGGGGPSYLFMITFPGFSESVFDYSAISPAQYEQIREHRDWALDLLADGMHVRQEMSMAPATDDERHYLGRLEMILDLNGSEKMEAVIEAAEKLKIDADTESRTLAAAQKSGRNDWAGSARRGLANASMSTLLCLLYMEEDGHVMQSEYVKQWYARHRNQKPPVDPAKMDASSKAYYVFDPKLASPVSFHDLVGVPPTIERYEQILAWAKDFVKRVPPEKRLGTKRMSPEPRMR